MDYKVPPSHAEERKGARGLGLVAKGKGASGRSSGPWKGGPQKRNPPNQQPISPKQTKDVTPRPSRKANRGADAASSDGARESRPTAPARGATRGAPRTGAPNEGFAQSGRSQQGKPGPTQRSERPTRESGKANKPWANRSMKDRRADLAAQSEKRERDERARGPLAPRRTERSEMRPARDATARSLRLPSSPAPTNLTPLERRRAYRYGGEVAVDRDIVYGRNAVAEALRAGRRKARLLLLAEGTEDRKAAGDLATLAAAHNVEVEHVTRVEIDRRAPGVNHQGVVLEVGPYPYAKYEDLLEAMHDNPEALLLVLDSVQDPQNLGTLLRTAEAAGVTGVVIPEHRAVQVTPAVVNASAGAVEYLPVAVVTNLVRAVEQAKEAGAWVVAAEAVPEAVPPSEADLTGPLVIVIGSEGQGVSRLLRETCDLTVRIPLVGKVGSLNAATAGSILLYEVVRQRAEAAGMADLVATLGDEGIDGDDGDE